MITVEKIGDETYWVTVEAMPITTHAVRLSNNYYQKLTGGAITPEKLIEKSFEFLLERESNTNILASFDLPVIGKYFPEYEKTISLKKNL